MNNEHPAASDERRPTDPADPSVDATNPASTPTAAQPTAAQPTAAADSLATEPTAQGGGQAGDPAAAGAVESGEAEPARRKIQIGSRRREGADVPTTVTPQVVVPPPPEPDAAIEPPPVVPRPSGPVPTPSVRDPLPEDLERELAAALEGASLDDLLGATAPDTLGTAIELESRIKCTVARIHGDNVFFSLGGRNEGVASLRQFPEPPEIGTEVDVVVRSFQPDDGLYELALAGAATQVEDWSDVVEGTVVEARITGANTGGLECKVGNLRAFIPASQIAIFRVEDYAEYIDQKLHCVVTEANPRRKNLVLSRRAVLEREKEAARQQLLESLEAGQIYEGTVRKIMDFGVFVDIGGIDGLVHVSQLSWDHVQHPQEVVQDGQKIRVKVEKVDPQTGKIGLSHRDLLDHPWLDVETQFPPESTVKGTVSRIAKFGAFVKLAPGVEGLVHISELSHARVPTVSSVVSEGQEVDVKVLSVDTEAQRIALSMKAVIPVPQMAASGARRQIRTRPKTS